MKSAPAFPNISSATHDYDLVIAATVALLPPMDPMTVILGVFAVLVIAAAIYGKIQAQKRREGMFDLAQRLNLTFDDNDNYSLADAYAFFSQLNKGDNRYATNILSGTYQNNKVLAFDFHYQTYSSDDKGNRQTHHHWFSFLILTLPCIFPNLTIHREGFFTKIAEAFGYQAIKFESAEFSRTFCVRSPDKKFAYDFCNAPMIEYLLANRDLSIEIGRQALALAFDSRLSVEQIEKDLQRLVEIRARFPQYLIANA